MLFPEIYLLDVTIPSHRGALSRLRCSNHSLHIESGRVNNVEIEDEYHFVLMCPFYIDLRVHI